jgi:hypothetical protein
MTISNTPLADILRHAPDGIVVAEGIPPRLSYANETLAALLRVPATALVGRALDDLENETPVDVASTATVSGASTRVQLKRADGSVVACERWAVMLPDGRLALYYRPQQRAAAGSGVDRASGLATVEDFRSAGREASVAFAITKYMPGYAWLSNLVTVAILAGFSSVILVMLLGQSRVFFSMSRDGLVPPVFAAVHPRYKTPYKSNWLFFFFTSLFAAFVPVDIVGEMTSIGTLFAFVLVCIGVWILRRRRPDVPRGFTVPALPVVSILGVLVCGSMIYGLGWTNWMRLIVWLAIGFVIYFGYSAKHSVAAREAAGGRKP